MPSFLQTLLRKPSQSYQAAGPSAYDQAPPLPTARGGAGSSSRAPSLRQGAEGSIRSSYSHASSVNGDDVHTGAQGQQWSWDMYASRKGSAGVGSSLHPSDAGSQLGVKRSVSRAVARRVGGTASDAGSIRADSVYSNYEDDGRSLHSAKSHSSLRSAASVSSAWRRDQLNGSLVINVPGVTKRTSRRYTDVANTPSLRRLEASDTASIASSTASDYYRNGSAPSRSRSMSGPDPSTLKTSRKYSSASGTTTITTSGYQVVTTTEYTSKKSSSQRNKKTTSTPSSSYAPSLTGTDRTPSLYSTTSSTGSSRGPLTPVYPTSSPMLGSPDLLPPPSMSKDALKKEKRKKRTQGNTLIEEAVKRAGLPLDSVVELEEEPTTAEAVKQKATATAKTETTAPIKVLQEQQIEHGRKVETEAKPSKDGTSLAAFDETASDDSRTPSLSTTTTAASSEPLTPETETVSTYANGIPPSAEKKKLGPGDIPRIVTDFTLADDSDAQEIALNEATPTTPSTPVEVPRIQLTRTASDQLADRVQGDIDLSGYDSQSPRNTEGEVSRRSSTASRKSSSESVSRPVTSDPSVGSDSPRSKQSTRPASIDSIEDPKASSTTTTTTTAAQDQPQWMKRIKALGEPIAPLVESPKLKAKTPEPHWTVKHHYEQQQQSRAPTSQDIRRPASAGNLRRPKSIMEPMPEEREDEEPTPALPASSLALTALPISASRHARLPSSPSLPSRGAFPTGVKERSAGKLRNPKPRTAAVAPTPGPPAILPHHVLAPRPDSLFLPSPIYYDASARQPPRPTSMHEVAASAAPTLELSTPKSRSTSPPEAESAPRAERTSLGRTVSLSQSAPASDSNASRFEIAPKRTMSLTRRNSDNSAQMEFTPLPFPFLLDLSSESPRDVPQAVSSYSDAGSDDEGDARSISGFSAMSMPVAGAHSRPPKNPRHEIITARNRESLVTDPIDFTATQQTTSLMTAVSVSAIAALGAQPRTFASGGSGWSLFKKAAPPLASTASPKKFDPLRDLTVSSMQPLPKKVKADEVLVEVFAVPIERVDVDRAKKAASQQEGFGWIPGRGFYGKVVDTGLEVNKVKQGELVWGVQPLKKSGALADLITVHKSLVTPAPSCDLTVEQIATLPIAGAASLQVMEVLCSTVPAGAKILVLGAHIGVGNLCLQLSRHLRPARDLYLVAQCPPERREDQVFCRESGASDVLLDDPLTAINRLHENEFDVVIDTIGGSKIYEAARRVLLNSGSFVTTVGESSAVAPTSSTQFKESVRSFRRNIFKKNKKHINYWFASLELDERDSTRDVLDRLRPIVEADSLMPRLGRLYPMKEACSAFSGKAAAEGGSVVCVKVV